MQYKKHLTEKAKKRREIQACIFRSLEDAMDAAAHEQALKVLSEKLKLARHDLESAANALRESPCAENSTKYMQAYKIVQHLEHRETVIRQK